MSNDNYFKLYLKYKNKYLKLKQHGSSKKYNSKLIFISAQPDTNYFHWQTELYLHNFTKFISKDKCYVIFSYEIEPSDYIKKLKEKYPNIYWYKDERKDKSYEPSIRPHILKKFFKDYPELGKFVFYHDSDILFRKLPDFDKLLEDDIIYLSDTISYIGYEYIMEVSKRYHDKYPELESDDLLVKMAKLVDIPVETIKSNQNNSGGAQYLLKNIDYDFWNQSEIDQNKLHLFLSDYEKKYPIENHIQKWTAGMWAELWNLWKRRQKTKVLPELSFSWANDTIEEYKKHNIFHLAGEVDKDKQFWKGSFDEENPISKLKEDPDFFNYIDKNSATNIYIDNMKDYIESL